MAKINVLSKHLAELIAAGEVVERPASVVKELMENSIDAGATSITVEIRNGGVTYIRITDNGCGIEKEDVPKAFISHATSKICNEDDLNSIFTLGFRGEALASIAAVSRTELLTRAENEHSGTSYAVEGGVQTRYEQAGCPQGTTIIVRDLFFNTPARMKFLKRDVSEANAVAEVVDRIALSNPHISVRFIREGKQALLTPGDSRLISAIYAVFGRSFADSLVEVDYELDGIGVKGYVCKPAFSRPSRSMQYFFLNGRYIKSRSCMASMENAYKNSVMVGKFPSCVLNIIIPPAFVDVNVHPAKTEVRFSDERRVSSAVYYAVKSAIETLDTPVAVNLAKVAEKTRTETSQLLLAVEDDEPATKIAPYVQTVKNIAVRSENADYHSKDIPRKSESFWSSMPSSQYRTTVSATESEYPAAQNTDEPDLVSSFKRMNTERTVAVRASDKIKTEAVKEQQKTVVPGEYIPPSHNYVPVRVQDEKDLPPKPLRLLGEAFKTYIICEYDGKIYFIDKHAAHERLIYNKIKKAAENNVSSQVLLTPVTVTLNKNDYDTVIDNLEVFSKAGYLVEDFGSGVVIVRECPMFISGDDIEDTVVEIASYLVQNKTNVESEKIDRIHHTSACKAAIKAGYKNSTAEMKVLAEQVLYDDEIRYCPHGRPVMIEMSKYDLEKQFGRIQ